MTGSIIQSSNYRGQAATSGVSICGTTTTGNISIGTGLLSAGSLTIGTSASPCSINSTTTFLNLPLCSAVPNALTQLVNKSYVNDNFVDKTSGQNIGGNKTFLNNINCSGTLTGSIIQSSNYRGGSATSRVSICGTTTTENISIGTGLLSAGSLTIGTSASPCSINSTTPF